MNVVTEVIELVDSQKGRAAFLAPLVLAIGAAVASWAVSGEFNANEIRVAAGGAVLALVSSVATWLTPASAVVVDSGAVQREVDAVQMGTTPR